MKRECLDEAILQGYLDGELSPELSREAAVHINACAACAAALREAGSELTLLASAFAPDPALSVPTERLRARIGAGVAQLHEAPARSEKGRGLQKLLSPLSALLNFTPQRAAFASLLALALLTTVYFIVKPDRARPETGREVAGVETPTPRPAATQEPRFTPAPPPRAGGEAEIDRAARRSAPRVTNARYPKARRDGVPRPTPDESIEGPDPLPTNLSVPGEQNYLGAIASLGRAIEAGGDVALRPAIRAEYERNLAVVDQAINATRRVALQNPNDKDAVGYLFSAYQRKVELMRTVADQAQIATLGR